MRFIFLVFLSLIAGCTPQDNSNSASADTSFNRIPPPPESLAARDDSINHGPPVCRRRPGSTLITSKGIGPAQLGVSLDSMKKLCTVRDSALRADEGQPENGRAISVGEGSAPILLFIDDSTRTIRQATTSDPFFRIVGDVGIASTVGELRQNHKQLCGDLGPTGIEVWARSLPGVVFGTTAYPPKMPNGGTGLRSGASAVPDTAKITTISVSTITRPCPGSR